jgi:exodeoxyribonuclease VIII
MTACAIPQSELAVEAYHARDEWSHSQMEVLLQSAPLFYGRFISHEYDRETTSALDDGTIVHHCLTGGDIADIVAMIPKNVLNADGHRKGKAWQDWSAANAGKIQRRRCECDALFRMIESVWQHPKAAWLLGGEGFFEHSIFWTDTETGLDLRCRPDRVKLINGEYILADIKTTRATTPREFSKDCVAYGYHRQAAWYIDGAKSLGWDVPAWCFITVDKTPAHECHVYELHPAAIEKGREENRVLLHELRKRLDAGNWNAPDHGSIVQLDLPTWAYREDDWRMTQ